MRSQHKKHTSGWWRTPKERGPRAQRQSLRRIPRRRKQRRAESRFTEASEAEKSELAATKKYESELHVQCDYLMANFELRQKSRTQEAEALESGKAVLQGADFSFVQGKVRMGKRLRGKHSGDKRKVAI